MSLIRSLPRLVENICDDGEDLQRGWGNSEDLKAIDSLSNAQVELTELLKAALDVTTRMTSPASQQHAGDAAPGSNVSGEPEEPAERPDGS